MRALVSIKNLTVQFHTYDGSVIAVNNVNLNIGEGETYGLVGETGCGKTITALSILRLIPPPGRIETGSIDFRIKNDGEPVDLLGISENEIRSIRGNKIAMIFQEPNSALNPVYTIGDQISESILLHRRSQVVARILDNIDAPLDKAGFTVKTLAPVTRFVEKAIYKTVSRNPATRLPDLLQQLPIIRNLLWRTRREAMEMATDLLKDVEIPDSERIIRQYPHELSGGMKQRAVIAMSLACNPKLLIADEPTTALDVTIQAQILDLLRNLKKEHGASILYITHDLGVAAEICDRIGVMYCGGICEEAGVDDIYSNPLHPYTQALMAAIPRPGQTFKSIPGYLPDLTDVRDRCEFQPRCIRCEDICKNQSPGLREVSPGHFVACHLV
ncbi:MAG: ABC transporter ATP-binding protein [Dehalococcoidales bacterium]|nr:ABC transporter ATP-binding protein [Dehalococcoidales bacterium]